MVVLFCLLDGRSAARASQRDRGPPGEHSPAESGAAAPDAHYRQLYSPGIPGVYVCVCVFTFEEQRLCLNISRPKVVFFILCIKT